MNNSMNNPYSEDMNLNPGSKLSDNLNLPSGHSGLNLIGSQLPSELGGSGPGSGSGHGMGSGSGLTASHSLAVGRMHSNASLNSTMKARASEVGDTNLDYRRQMEAKELLINDEFSVSESGYCRNIVLPPSA